MNEAIRTDVYEEIKRVTYLWLEHGYFEEVAQAIEDILHEQPRVREHLALEGE